MIKTKKQMFIVIGSFLLVILLGTTTYAFFNYTKTGVVNTIKVGRIYFNTNQTETLNLTNVFPISRDEEDINSQGIDAVTIEIEGDTTYSNGIEYLITAEDVNVTVNDKIIPVSLYVSESENLGYNDADYYDNRGGNTSIYKPLADSLIVPGQYILVGYIAKGQTGINGEVKIKAFIDKEKVLVSDTYPEGNVTHIDDTDPENPIEVYDYTNLTPNSMAQDKIVLTTDEWNNISGNNSLSFKIRVEANEGIWVDPETNPNAATRIPASLKSGITEIYFIKETPIRMQERYDAASVKANMTDTTLNEGKVLAWQEEDRLYIASSGETYLPVNSARYFSGLSNVTKIEFKNINTSRVTNMAEMFYDSGALTTLDLSGFDTSSVQYMHRVFANCYQLQSIDLSSFDTSNVINMNEMFYYCESLLSINLDNFNTNNITDMGGMFQYCSSLTTIDLSNLNTPNLKLIQGIFKGCQNLRNVNLSGLGSIYLGSENSSAVSGMFSGCNNLKEINMSGFNFGTSSMYNDNQFQYSPFSNLISVETLNLSNANVSNVTNIEGMFYNCNNLTSINMSGFVFGTSISGLFNNVSSLVNIDLSNANASNVTSMGNMFSGCTNLEEIDMSGFIFGTSTIGLFNNASSVINIDLSNANTSNVTNMAGMFSGCSNLTSVNLSGINTNSVTNTGGMFSGCTSLTTIYASNTWNVSNVTISGGMFYNCTSLVGGNGTTYDNTKMDKTMAVIDTPTTEGYLTLKTN